MSEIGLFLSQFSIDHAVVFYGVVTSDFKSSEFLFSTHIFVRPSVSGTYGGLP